MYEILATQKRPNFELGLIRYVNAQYSFHHFIQQSNFRSQCQLLHCVRWNRMKSLQAFDFPPMMLLRWNESDILYRLMNWYKIIKQRKRNVAIVIDEQIQSISINYIRHFIDIRLKNCGGSSLLFSTLESISFHKTQKTYNYGCVYNILLDCKWKLNVVTYQRLRT